MFPLRSHTAGVNKGANSPLNPWDRAARHETERRSNTNVYIIELTIITMIFILWVTLLRASERVNLVIWGGEAFLIRGCFYFNPPRTWRKSARVSHRGATKWPMKNNQTARTKTNWTCLMYWLRHKKLMISHYNWHYTTPYTAASSQRRLLDLLLYIYYYPNIYRL